MAAPPPIASDEDLRFMRLALAEAAAALEAGSFPVGAVLAIGGELVGGERNRQRSREDRASHAELSLLVAHSRRLREASKREHAVISLYSTLEPCLMCLGAAVVHRVSRLVVSCPDPQGGATALEPRALGSWYAKRWPKIQAGLLREEAHQMLTTFASRQSGQSWIRRLEQLEKLRQGWS